VTQSFPSLVSVVLDTANARALAEFYRELLGYKYRAGDEPPAAGQPDERGQDWLILEHPAGPARLAFQQVQSLPHSTWPDAQIPQQLHLDLSVPTMAEFERQHARATELGATVLFDRSKDEHEPLYVYADPDGHPFCIFVSAGS
jgi:catechol 2,3-dioxygenase-like lactoylglutathione lyase family enzyme